MTSVVGTGAGLVLGAFVALVFALCWFCLRLAEVRADAIAQAKRDSWL